MGSSPDRFAAVYVGGGTPTSLSIKLLERLLSAAKSRAGTGAEFTVEANPESADDEKLALMLENGVNRVSIGAQSFNDAKLKTLGRIHDSRRAINCVELAHKSGFKNINVDLMFGVRGETKDCWKKDLEIAAGLPVNHISCYALDCKRLEAQAGAAELYEYAIDYLPKKGLAQYEISNFSLTGFECRHNLNYWDNGQYLGLGPSAVSYIDGVRSIEGAPGEKLGNAASAKETAAIKIRTMKGIDFGWFYRKTGFDFPELEKDALPRILEEGLVEYTGGASSPKGVRLTRRGILFCDIVSGAFL